MGRERPGALLARRTRTVKLCSFDARSKGQPWPLPSREVKKVGETSLGLLARLGVSAGGPLVSCARATRTPQVSFVRSVGLI